MRQVKGLNDMVHIEQFAFKNLPCVKEQPCER